MYLKLFSRLHRNRLVRRQRRYKCSLQVPSDHELVFTHISEFELMEPWTMAKSFEPIIPGSVETSLDLKSDSGSSFVTFRPRGGLSATPARISTQMSDLYEEIDGFDMPLESPQQICVSEKVPWHFAKE